LLAKIFVNLRAVFGARIFSHHIGWVLKKEWKNRIEEVGIKRYEEWKKNGKIKIRNRKKEMKKTKNTRLVHDEVVRIFRKTTFEYICKRVSRL
jgi:hypothetical protein